MRARDTQRRGAQACPVSIASSDRRRSLRLGFNRHHHILASFKERSHLGERAHLRERRWHPTIKNRYPVATSHDAPSEFAIRCERLHSTSFS
ncbi:unnamed protein product [Leptosia nina]|uniref:Uncharacterized protein n=1 Tax=Leptosia nina TaxID=320188 RepID=A0AAV1IVR4_9NEOP